MPRNNIGSSDPDIGAGSDDYGYAIDPGAIDIAAPEEPPVRKRKRRADAGIPRGERTGSGSASGARTRTKKENVALDLSAFTGMLVGISTMLALQTGHEEIAIGEDEMSSWLGAAQKVARHYSVETTQKTLDWLAFGGMSAQVFGPRVVALSVKAGRSKRRRSSNVQPLHAVVTDIQPQAYDAE